MSHRKFRDSGHIFYLKFNDKERSKTIPTNSKNQVYLSGDLKKKYVDASVNLVREESNPEDSMLTSP